MRMLSLIALLLMVNTSQAFSEAEIQCVTKSTYLESRSLSKVDWKKTANVAANRARQFHKYAFGSKSANLCDIVRSKEYHSAKDLRSVVREKDTYNKIESVLRSEKWTALHSAVFFNYDSRKHRMNYTNYPIR